MKEVGRKMGAKPCLSEHKSRDAGEQGQPNQREFCGFLERAMGIEPTSEVWAKHTANCLRPPPRGSVQIDKGESGNGVFGALRAPATILTDSQGLANLQ
jgi:hypothetical protein